MSSIYYDRKPLPDGRTILRAFIDGKESIWRIAPRPQEIQRKQKLLERDVELWIKGIKPESL